MSRELLDLLKVEKTSLDGSEYYILQLGLSIMAPLPEIIPVSNKEEILQFFEEEIRRVYIRRLLELVFNYLFKKKLKDLKILNCNIILTPEIQEDCIILHPSTLARLLQEEETKDLWEGKRE